MKIRYCLLFSSIVFFVMVSNSYSASYTTIQPPVQLTDTTYHNISKFAVSKNNYIDWNEDDKILLYDGTSISEINDNISANSLQINDSGHVVWEDSNQDIFSYNGSDIIQLGHGYSPQINDNDAVVWVGSDGNDAGIFLYDGSGTTQVLDNDINDSSPQINQNGWVVWQADGEIFLFDGSMTTQLTNDSNWDDSPQINDNGNVVWDKNLGQYEIFLYDGSSTTQLTENSRSIISPKINNNGCIVWTGADSGLDEEIYFYDGSKISQITNNNTRDRDPQINSNGYIVWSGYDGTDYEIYLYDGNNTYQVTDNDIDDLSPQIRDDGLLVWLGCPQGEDSGDIYYARIQANQNGSGLSPPTLIQPTDKSEVTSLTPTLSVSNSSDKIDSGLTCEFQIDVTSSFNSSSLLASPEISVNSDGTATWQPGTLADNTLYYWRVRASDGTAQSNWVLFSFFVNLFNDAPEAPVTTGQDQIWVDSSLEMPIIYLSVTPAIDLDHDELTYTFELYKDASLTTLLCSGDSESPSWEVPISLQLDTSYYYRVRATDEHGLQGPWSPTTELAITEMEEEGSDLNLSLNPTGSGCFITNAVDGSFFESVVFELKRFFERCF